MEQKNNKPSWTKVAEVELVYKTKIRATEMPKINGSKDCCEILLSLWNNAKIELQEDFEVLLIDRVHSMKGIYEASAAELPGR